MNKASLTAFSMNINVNVLVQMLLLNSLKYFLSGQKMYQLQWSMQVIL